MGLLATDGFFAAANNIEAAVWIVIGLVFGGWAVVRGGVVRRRCVLAAIVFVAFGVSDIVEVRTGAWWRPWWLFCWKAGCVLAMAWLLWTHIRVVRGARGMSTDKR